MRVLLSVIRVEFQQFMGSVIEDRLVTWPSLRDQLFNNALVRIENSCCSQKLRRLQLQLVGTQLLLCVLILNHLF